MRVATVTTAIAVKAITIFAAFAALSSAQVRNVAVVESEVDVSSGASAEITSAEARLVTTELRREAVKNLPAEKYNIMTTETVYAQGSATLEECAEENCVITLGSRIGADYIVRGLISKLRDRFTLSVEVYETENGNLVASSTPVRSDSIEDLVEKAAAACADMYEKFVSAESSKRKPKTKYVLEASANPADGGTVLRNPDRDEYPSGTRVSVMATPADGYAFTGWSGAVTGTENPATVVMDAGKTLMANFVSASEPEQARSAAAASGKKRRRRPNVGVNGFFANSAGSGLTWAVSGEALLMPSFSGGACLYYEYMAAKMKRMYTQYFVGYSGGGGKWESVSASNQNDLPDVTRTSFLFGAGAKWPFEVKDNIRLFPMWDFVVEIPTETRMNGAVYKYESSEGGLGGLNIIEWIRLGLGVDYDLNNLIYLRAEALYGIGLTALDEMVFAISSNLDPQDVSPNWISRGMSIRIGVGFKL